MSQPPPNIRRTSSRVYDIHNPDDLNELARKLSRRRSRRSTGASQHPYTPGLGETQYGFPQSTQQGAYVSEPGQYGDASNVALATPLGVPRLKSYDQSREGDEYAGGEELAPSTSRRSRASQRPREESVREDDEEASGSDDDDDMETEDLLAQIFGASGTEDQAHVKENLGIYWEDLTVFGKGAGEIYFKTLGSLLDPLLHPGRVFSKKAKEARSGRRTLIDNFAGVVKPGEMCLVLGRPGSGGLRRWVRGFEEIDGEVKFGDISMEKMKKHYRGEVAFNAEEDVHMPTLSVEQTLRFAVSCRAPRANQRHESQSRQQFVDNFMDVLGKVFGLERVFGTRVGNAQLRGVSGGEKKRVSISEVLASRSLVTMWDSATRGLDSSSAVQYVKALRALTNLTKGSTLVTLYQASDSLWDLFDKVLLIDAGKLVYFGPTEDAIKYFEETVGFERQPRQTATDYLNSCTDPVARKPKEGFEGKVPTSPEEMAKRWQESDDKKRADEELKDYKQYVIDHPRGKALQESTEHEREKDKRSAGSNYTISLWRQITLLTRRQTQLILRDRPALAAKYGGAVFQALIAGSAFYNQQYTTNSAFTFGGAAFLSILFMSLQGLAELTNQYQLRPILVRHQGFPFYRMSAFALSQVLIDAPVIAGPSLVFSIILYFLVNLKREPGQFFIFWLFLWLVSMTTYALFRCLAAITPSLDVATRFSGLLIQAIVVYAGYTLAFPNMRYYFRWLPWINPAYYGFEAIVANQFHHTNLQCAEGSYVPFGPTYTDPAYGSCTLAGSQPGQQFVDGDAYIKAQFSYSYGHVWRNMGALFGFLILFVVINMVGLELALQPGKDRASIVEYKRTKNAAINTKGDKEDTREQGHQNSNEGERHDSSASSDATVRPEEDIQPHKSIFTFENVNYTVPVKGGSRQLLTNCRGMVKPGRMVALMGASGAGKTTLLSALCQRLGTAEGDFQLDGQPLPPAFQRMVGFAEQADVHDEWSTVREAFRFSAILRQPKTVSREDKHKYVETVIDLLELRDYAEARIGSGLSIEIQKRVTIGVELSAKPSLLFFLDEPTSGLDGQGAWNLCRFLRKLVSNDQAILATIHQPSSELLFQFDDLLLLARGGKTVYNGPIGKQGETMIKYFESNGAKKIEEGANPSEWAIDIIGRPGNKDWPKIWEESEENKKLAEDIHKVQQERKSKPVAEDVDRTSKYAASYWTQTQQLFKRTFTGYWRDVGYISGKIFLHIFTSLFNGLTFLKLGNAIIDTQSTLFSIFIFLTTAPPLIQQLQPQFLRLRGLYEAREGAAKIYSWVPLVASAVFVEWPISVLAGWIYFAIWWNLVGFPGGGRAGYGFLLVTLFELYLPTFGQMLAAIAPNAFVASLLVPIFFTFVILFSGVLVPPAALPYFWRSWMLHLTPFRYLLSSLLNVTLHDQPIQCTNKEYVTFDPPPGQTCAAYMQAFFSSGNPGYLESVTESATANCRYCQYSNADQYLATLEVYWYNLARDIGVFVCYIVFLLTWLVRFRSNPFKSLVGKKSRKNSTPSTEAQSGKEQGNGQEKAQGYSAAPAPAAATA
ncbi:hypothetical protein QFC20_001394 [Naganishia adeliensis]|uniref:Uncharacterized protein n=1 Tax=Naganishia adeliensis TaxID=92952 RepID=A0ACC2WUM6_9TREE|nr:hypothetical protein QFC20_001394 [Naganishia adeliensis]